MKGVRIEHQAMDLLMPLHLVFDKSGRVLHGGPTLVQLTGTVTGRRLSDILTIRRPTVSLGVQDLFARAGRRLSIELRLQEDRQTDGNRIERLTGVAVPLAQGGGVLAMAFGPDIAQVTRRHGLTAGDFSSIDPVLNMLYLIESQALIRKQLGAMTERLDAALQDAETAAETDRLTGLFNRRALDRALGGLLAEPNGKPLCLMHLDLDHFKAVNDTLGHAAGDAVLVETASILREETRQGDHVCRMGGDEFVIILPGCSDQELAATVAKRILARLSIPIPFQGEFCKVSGSIGITFSEGRGDGAYDALLAEADEALYASKRAGRSRLAFHGAEGERLIQAVHGSPATDASETRKAAS